MNDIAIRVNGLSKQYFIKHAAKKHDRLGDQLVAALSSPVTRVKKLLRGEASGAADLDEEMWALKELSFEIKYGEVVGIIGRNGAGKSTLLKILSRITDPTNGYADIFGRVGSLLEVGTGFHPELTGRENIYLNGAILGMRRREIEKKFDEIVAFAEIDRFIDTPVKHYSSGMYVRLAFSVAAHLEPDILLIDEVLAVGDVAFQRKCLGKMNDVAHQGRTVLFVSHNMGLLQALCQRGILLQNGKIAEDGSVSSAIDTYLRTLEQAEAQDLTERMDRRGRGHTRLVHAEVTGDAQDPGIIKTGRGARFNVQVTHKLPSMNCNILLFDSLGQPLANFESKWRSPSDTVIPDQDTKFVCEVDELYLRPGRYRMDIAIIGDNVLQDFIEAALFFDVSEGHLDGRPIMAHNKFRMTMPHRWLLPAEE